MLAGTAIHFSNTVITPVFLLNFSVSAYFMNRSLYEYLAGLKVFNKMLRLPVEVILN